MGVARAHRLGLDNVTKQYLSVDNARRMLERAACEVVRVDSEQLRHGDTPIRGSVITDYDATRR